MVEEAEPVVEEEEIEPVMVEEEAEPVMEYRVESQTSVFDNSQAKESREAVIAVQKTEISMEETLTEEEALLVEEKLTINDSDNKNEQLVVGNDSKVEKNETILFLAKGNDLEIQTETSEEDEGFVYFEKDLYQKTIQTNYGNPDVNFVENSTDLKGLNNFNFLSFDDDNPDPVHVNSGYDLLRQDIDNSFDTEVKSQAVKTKIVTVTTATFSAGIVSYLLRAGSLLASLASNMPLWSGFDPITILTGKKEKLKNKNEPSDPKELKVETLFEGETR